jgi:hypothetical protein
MEGSDQFAVLQLLLKLFPDSRIIDGADHDIIYLRATCDGLSRANATNEQITELKARGVFFHEGGSLAMFV